MALGGGGTAYLTGFESLFVNPANLYIQEKNYRFQISLLQGGLYYDTLLPYPNNIDRFKSYNNHTQLFDGYTNVEKLGVDDYEILLNRNYPGNNTTRKFLTQTDFYWFGLKWVRPERSYGLAFRTRYSSRYEIGKGYFSKDPIERNGSLIVDQSFDQKSQILHEISFGYAESFTYLNGLFPQLSEFIIGIAPKFVISGSSLHSDFTNIYKREEESLTWNHTTSYSQKNSGVLTGYSTRYFNSASLPSDPNHSFKSLMKPAGYGFGIDIGVTYMLTFGDDLSMLRQQNQPTEKSLRLSFSLTDVGVVIQNKSPIEYKREENKQSKQEPAPLHNPLPRLRGRAGMGAQTKPAPQSPLPRLRGRARVGAQTPQSP